MSKIGFLTPDFPPDHRFYSRRLLIPATAEFLGLVNGALAELCHAHNWEKDGEMTEDEAAEYFTEMFAAYLHNQNEPPEWEEPDQLDGLPEASWYEDLADWVIQGFLAITFTPQAAIVYSATVPKLRVALRTGDLGALFRVLINGVEVWSGDSYTPLTDLIEQVFDMSTETEPYTVRIEHNGVGPNINGTEAKLEVIRGEAVASMVQTILRADPAGCGVQWSLDNGGTWSTIDLATCIDAIAYSAIQDAVRNGVISGPSQPGPGGEVPPAECQTFNVHLEARDIWHCPVPVQSAYSIEIADLRGGWSDGTLAWYCPDGSRFLLGTCDEELSGTEETDPLPTENHMMLIGHIDDLYFDPTAYTVPTGHDATELFLQANDSSLDDNQGSADFAVTICNYAEWTHTFDFETGQHGWTAEDYSGSHTVYTAGQGFQDSQCSGQNDFFAVAYWNFGTTVNNIDGVDVYVKSSGFESTLYGVAVWNNAAGDQGNRVGSHAWSGDLVAIHLDMSGVSLTSLHHRAQPGLACNYAVTVTLGKLVFSGHGVDPFI